jgi:hypothetical protein
MFQRFGIAEDGEDYSLAWLTGRSDFAELRRLITW